jgi:hypothetical protein
MRYFVAVILSLALISVIWIGMLQIKRLKDKRWHEGFLAAKERGDIPPDADINTAAFGTEVVGFEVLAFNLLTLWEDFRIFLIPMIIAGSLTIAWYTSDPAPRRQLKVSESDA